jgi:hypothetical protein
LPLPALIEVVAFALAAHAYIIGRKARQELYTPTPGTLPVQPVRADSSLPAALPWVVTSLILGGYYLIIIIVQFVVLDAHQ